MKLKHLIAAIALVAGMAGWSSPSSGNCPCGGACNHPVTPEVIGRDIIPPILIIEGTSESLIVGSLFVMDVLSGVTNWWVNSVFLFLEKLNEWRQSLNRYLITGYWQRLDYCPVCREQAAEIIKHAPVYSPHQAFAMLLAWLKDQSIPAETVTEYFECMNTGFPVLKLLKPVLSSEYQFEAAAYPIGYLPRILNGFAQSVPYPTMIFVDSLLGHMVGVIQIGEQMFSVYLASINERITVNSFEELETVISNFYRSIRPLRNPANNGKIILIGIDR